jgi:hypothetical protein
MRLTMRLSRYPGLMLLFVLSSAASLAAKTTPCVAPEKAAASFNKHTCISAHVFEIVELSDGTRFLDTCSPSTPDEQCRFTILSPAENRESVGQLSSYRNRDLMIRGTVEQINGRYGIILSRQDQLKIAPPKFRPNPLLTHGFSADESRPPVSDPNLRRQGGRRAFMNTRNQQPMRAK